MDQFDSNSDIQERRPPIYNAEDYILGLRKFRLVLHIQPRISKGFYLLYPKRLNFGKYSKHLLNGVWKYAWENANSGYVSGVVQILSQFNSNFGRIHVKNLVKITSGPKNHWWIFFNHSDFGALFFS